MIKVFLGGTCNGSKWRDKIIPILKENKIDFFNPVVENWTPECQIEEYRQKDICDIHLYNISKEMNGVFSIAEAVDSSHLNDTWCFFQVDPIGFTDHQLKSLYDVGVLIQRNGGSAYIGNTFDRFIKDILDYIK